MSLTYLLLVSQTGQRAAGLPVRNDPPRVLIGGEEAHDPARDHVTNVGENAPCLVHLCANFAACERCNNITARNLISDMCVCYHAWRVSVLVSKIQLLTRWTAAQDEGKNVLGRNYMTYTQSYQAKRTLVILLI